MVKLILDFYRESQDAAKERLKLPIIPFYITLVILAYWRPISIYLFSKSSIENKIKLINKLYSDWNELNHLWTLVLLIIISFLSSIIFPLLMWAIESVLRKPNNNRKELQNKSKTLDMENDLEKTRHKYEMERILSGQKEVEEYNKSIEQLKKSYEDRITNIENINAQKEENLNSELRANISAVKALQEQGRQLRQEVANQAELDNDGNKFSESKLSENRNSVDFFKLVASKANKLTYLINHHQLFASNSMKAKAILNNLLRQNLVELYSKILNSIESNNILIIDSKNDSSSLYQRFLTENRIGEFVGQSYDDAIYTLDNSKLYFIEIKRILDVLQNDSKLKEFLDKD